MQRAPGRRPELSLVSWGQNGQLPLSVMGGTGSPDQNAGSASGDRSGSQIGEGAVHRRCSFDASVSGLGCLRVSHQILEGRLYVSHVPDRRCGANTVAAAFVIDQRCLHRMHALSCGLMLGFRAHAAPAWRRHRFRLVLGLWLRWCSPLGGPIPFLLVPAADHLVLDRSISATRDRPRALVVLGHAGLSVRSWPCRVPTPPVPLGALAPLAFGRSTADSPGTYPPLRGGNHPSVFLGSWVFAVDISTSSSTRRSSWA